MKKGILIGILIVLIIGGVIAFFMLSNSSKESTSVSGASGASRNINANFSLSYKNVNIIPGTKFNEGAINEEAILSTIPSCAFVGVDNVYTYSDVEITVSDINGEPTIYSVYLLGGNVATAEGVKIADNKALMLEKYGENYKSSVNNKYTYISGNVELSFVVQNDYIIQIEYTLITK